ncbi:MAG: hypothetical protein N4A63_15645 [Vallitalea sp.]|jgi:hypothetical protein|nr:hypothetical protein [Vallitalea sp.]
MKDLIIICGKIALGIFIAGALILGTIKTDDNSISMLEKSQEVMQKNLEYQKNFP